MTRPSLAQRRRLVNGENSRWWTLGARCNALLMIMFDRTVPKSMSRYLWKIPRQRPADTVGPASSPSLSASSPATTEGPDVPYEVWISGYRPASL
jgi:hypothetical protein